MARKGRKITQIEGLLRINNSALCLRVYAKYNQSYNYKQNNDSEKTYKMRYRTLLFYLLMIEV